MIWLKRTLVVACIAALGVIAAIITFAIYAPRDRAFTVIAQTETATVTVADPDGVAAVLPTVSRSSTPDAFLDDATLEVDDGATFTLSRRRDGSLFVRISYDGNAARARLVTVDGETIDLGSNETLRVGLTKASAPEASDSALISFRGQLHIGEDVTRLVRATLLSARVVIVERQPFSGDRLAVREASLDPGDRAEWRDANGKIVSGASGFFQVGDGPGFQVTAHAAADHLRVVRYGAADYVLQPSVWERLGRDPVIAGLLIALGMLSTGLGLVGALVKLWSTKEQAP